MDEYGCPGHFMMMTTVSYLNIHIHTPSGYPPIEGDTVVKKRSYAKEKLDHLRVMLMAEPRGHTDMYGALLVKPDLPEADMAVLFMDNKGK